MKIFTVNWKSLMIMFILTIAFLFTGNAIAQTDVNINSTNLIRVGGSVTVVEKQVVENAISIGGSTIIQPNGRVTQTAIAIGGNVILKQGARVDGDAYAIGGKVVQAEGATIGGSQSTMGGSKLLIVTVLALIPFVGGIVVCVVSLFGLGSLLVWKLGKAQPPILG